MISDERAKELTKILRHILIDCKDNFELIDNIYENTEMTEKEKIHAAYTAGVYLERGKL